MVLVLEALERAHKIELLGVFVAEPRQDGYLKGGKMTLKQALYVQIR